MMLRIVFKVGTYFIYMTPDKKVLTSWGKSEKRTIVGLKSLWHGGPRIIPYADTFYQKRPDLFLEKKEGNYQFATRREDDAALIFNPADYETNSISEAKKLALADAKNHKKLYQALIDKGIYPTGTQVNVKKQKHSNRFVIELKVPKLEEFDKYYREMARTSGVRQEELRHLEEIPRHVGNMIQDEAGKFGYRCFDPKNPTRYETNSDTFDSFNYGVDSKGDVRYFDKHVLKIKLPFKGRKKSNFERQLENIAKRADEETDVNKIGTYARAVISLVSAIGLLSGFFFLGSNLTGNVIADLTTKTTSFLGAGLIIVGLVGSFFWIKSKK